MRRAAAPAFRPTEIRLLVWVAAITVSGFVTVALAFAQRIEGAVVLVPAAFLAMSFGLHASLSLRGVRGDQILLPLALGLAGIGLVLIYRVTTGTDEEGLLPQQLAWCAVSIVALLLPLLVPRDLSILSRYKYTWMTLGLLLLVGTALRREHLLRDARREALARRPPRRLRWPLHDRAAA